MVEMRYEDYERARGKFQKTDIAERVISSKSEPCFVVRFVLNVIPWFTD
jgi:hypothetical protein